MEKKLSCSLLEKETKNEIFKFIETGWELIDAMDRLPTTDLEDINLSKEFEDFNSLLQREDFLGIKSSIQITISPSMIPLFQQLIKVFLASKVEWGKFADYLELMKKISILATKEMDLLAKKEADLNKTKSFVNAKETRKIIASLKNKLNKTKNAIKRIEKENENICRENERLILRDVKDASPILEAFLANALEFNKWPRGDKSYGRRRT